MNILKLDLDPEQIADLQKALNRHPKAYVRERASAILQIHEGKSGCQIARTGLLKKRRENTICQWVHRYSQHGIEGLLIDSGRGRKAAHFPPQPRASQSRC